MDAKIQSRFVNERHAFSSSRPQLHTGRLQTLFQQWQQDQSPSNMKIASIRDVHILNYCAQKSPGEKSGERANQKSLWDKHSGMLSSGGLVVLNGAPSNPVQSLEARQAPALLDTQHRPTLRTNPVTILSGHRPPST